MGFKRLIALILLIEWSDGKLPSFIKACSRNTPDLSKCIGENANYALPFLLKGASEFDIPPLVNLKLPTINDVSYLPFYFSFDGHIVDLEGVTYKQANFNLNKLVERGSLNFPKLELEGNYNINGLVGELLISGLGLANITLNNVTLEGIWTSTTLFKDGVDHMKMATSSLLSFNVDSVSYHFDNLFNGNKTQEEVANDFLNEHWWLLFGSFFPTVSDFVFELLFETIDRIFTYATYDELFPPK